MRPVTPRWREQMIAPNNADIAKKGHFWMETIYDTAPPSIWSWHDRAVPAESSCSFHG